MSLTSGIQDQKDHITQVKKDLCSKVGIPSEPPYPVFQRS